MKNVLLNKKTAKAAMLSLALCMLVALPMASLNAGHADAANKKNEKVVEVKKTSTTKKKEKNKKESKEEVKEETHSSDTSSEKQQETKPVVNTGVKHQEQAVQQSNYSAPSSTYTGRTDGGSAQTQVPVQGNIEIEQIPSSNSNAPQESTQAPAQEPTSSGNDDVVISQQPTEVVDEVTELN